MLLALLQAASLPDPPAALAGASAERALASNERPLAALRALAQEDGTVRVIVELDVAFVPEGELGSKRRAEGQQQAISDAQDELLADLPAEPGEATPVATFESIPYVVLEVDAAGLDALADNPGVTEIHQDLLSPPLLEESVPLIGADDAWAAGYTGAGQGIAVLDTGIDKSHPFFGGRVIGEACFSTTASSSGATSLCPEPDENGDQVGEGSGLNCPLGVSGCNHGTHVAGIAAGSGSDFAGVAPGAGLVSIQVFSSFSGSVCATYGMASPCVLSYTSDQLAALDWLFAERETYDLAAVNMSLGGGSFDYQCDADSRKAAIDNLRSVGVATIAAAGNSGSLSALTSPACISSVISVSATTDADQIAAYSNVAPFLSLLAPGSSILSSVPSGDYQTMSGTSMAAPHVSGAWAVLKQVVPEASVDELLAVLDSTGVPLSADGSTELTFSRIQLGLAVEALAPTPDLAGDLNLDGVVDVLDVQLCVNVFLGTETEAEVVDRADVNLDSEVNVLDVQVIVNTFLAG